MLHPLSSRVLVFCIVSSLTMGEMVCQTEVMPWEPAEVLDLSEEQPAELQRLIRAPKTPQKVVLRARVALAAVEGRSNNAIAKELGVSRPTVILWRGTNGCPRRGGDHPRRH